ncbi:substrate-binding domain-containing protein [Neobacillus jeddahensis]|uniref:substrate-binding domain-containing protein n=1 Tax=Neobacillus jeddahensis TaxID=1461580 RepID=UPI00058D0B8C|nr:substrate-binding domain-containing protein [Neobacillus jeddahensis]
MKLGKSILIISLCSSFLFSIAACSFQKTKKSEAGEIKYLIGMSQANLGEPWRVVMNEEIKEEASHHDGTRVIFTDAGQSSQKQISDVEKLIGLGIDLLIISPNEAEPLTPIIRKVHKKIPVIILDRAIIGDDYTMFIGADNKLIGKMAGQFVQDLLGPKGGNVVEITGLPGSPPAKERSVGFRNEIAKQANIHVVKTLVADWLRDNAESKFQTYLTQNNQIDLVYAHNDPMALGAYHAANLAGKKGIIYVGIDGLPGPNGGLDLVKRHILKGTFIYPNGGKEAVRYALKILHDEKVPKKVTLKSIKITENTLDEVE